MDAANSNVVCTPSIFSATLSSIGRVVEREIEMNIVYDVVSSTVKLPFVDNNTKDTIMPSILSMIYIILEGVL
jgi:hypothetical protein